MHESIPGLGSSLPPTRAREDDDYELDELGHYEQVRRGHRRPAPGKVTSTQRLRYAPPPAAAAVHAAAKQGVQGSGEALPFLDKIQKSFGAHDLSGVRAHIGGKAADAATAIGASAFATGSDVAFASAPDVHTAAHEAAHVVQQRAGVQLLGGVGEAGDKYERQADAVAEAVERGESAEGLLGNTGARSRAKAVGMTGSGHAPVQRKENLGRHMELAVGRALDDKKNAPSVNIRFRGVPVRPPIFFVANPDKLIRAKKEIISSRAAVRGVQTTLALAAGVSVQDHPAMRLSAAMRENTDGTVTMSLPSSFVAEPPTAEVAMYIAAHFAMLMFDDLYRQMANEAHQRNRHYDDRGNQGTPAQLARLYWMQIAQEGLAAVTGSVTGAVAAHVARWFTSDPRKIVAAATAANSLPALAGAGVMVAGTIKKNRSISSVGGDGRKGPYVPGRAGTPAAAGRPEFAPLPPNPGLDPAQPLTTAEANMLPAPHKGIIYVRESPRSPRSAARRAANDFEAGTTGARSDVASRDRVVPALRYNNPNPRGNKFVRFDGIEGTKVVIDAKTRILTFESRGRTVLPQEQDLRRINRALEQNPGVRAVFEFPTETARAHAEGVLRSLGIDAIQTRVRR